MARRQALSEEVAERLPAGEERFVDDEEFVYFFHEGFYRVPRPDWERILGHFTAETVAEHERVVEAGGLHIIGTERHEARRIDNQLRGRAGRQGDPGSSRFYLSLEDDLMRIFGSDRIQGLMERLGMEEGVPIEHGMVTKAIERAQKQVEGQNFSVRKHLLEYDDVMNKQRENVYALRRELLDGTDGPRRGRGGRHPRLPDASGRGSWSTARFRPTAARTIEPEEWDTAAVKRDVGVRVRASTGSQLDQVDLTDRNPEEMRDALWTPGRGASTPSKEAAIDAAVLRRVERDVMLQVVDSQWKDHLYGLDHLKEGIGLRGYGQRNPLVEYKRESFAMFEAMKERIEDDIVRYLWRLRPAGLGRSGSPRRPRPRPRPPPGRPDDVERPGRRSGRSSVPASASAPAWPTRRNAPQPARTGGDDAAGPDGPAGRCRRSAGTSRAPAGAARSSRSATGRDGMSVKADDASDRRAGGGRSPRSP